MVKKNKIKIISIIFVFFLIGQKSVCPQIVKPENKNEMPNKQIIKDESDSARQILAKQPDFRADMSCLKYEKTFGHGYGEVFKSAKKRDFYRQETKTYIDYFSPNEPPLRFTFKTNIFEPFTGVVENHLWFEILNSPALLAQDESLKFESVGKESLDFEIDGKMEKRERIKIKVTGETEVGGDWDKAEGFLYVAPELKNLVVKTELVFPNAGRVCTLKNVSFNVPEKLFDKFSEYRRQIGKSITLPKVSETIENKPEKIFLRGSIFHSWFDMKLERDGDNLSGSYFYTKSGKRNSLKLRGKIGANGNVVLNEFDEKNRQIGKFTGFLNIFPEDGRVTFSGYWKNSLGNNLYFSAIGQVIGINNDWQIRTKTISEKNKNKHFQIFAAYPEITFKNTAAIGEFNLLAKDSVAKTVADFRKRMLAKTAKDFKRPLFKDGDLYNTYYIKFADDNLISIEFFYFEFSDGMDDLLNSVKTLNYDLKNKRRLNLADLFKLNAKYVELISAYCIKDLQSRYPVKDQKSADEKLAKAAGADAKNFENWTLTKKGLLITFDSNKIVSDIHAAFSVLVPYSQLKEIAALDGILSKMMH